MGPVDSKTYEKRWGYINAITAQLSQFGESYICTIYNFISRNMINCFKSASWNWEMYPYCRMFICEFLFKITWQFQNTCNNLNLICFFSKICFWNSFNSMKSALMSQPETGEKRSKKFSSVQETKIFTKIKLRYTFFSLTHRAILSESEVRCKHFCEALHFQNC